MRLKVKLATRIKITFLTALLFSFSGGVFAQTSKVELLYLMCKGKVTHTTVDADRKLTV